MKRNRKYYKFALPALGIGLALGVIGSTTPSVINATNNINHSISVDSDQWNVTAENVLGSKIGRVRHWNNTSFSGVKVKDGGFVALTGTNSVSRTDSFGNILWTFNPSETTLNGYKSEWKDKKAVEIVQDQGAGFENVFYVLLAPKDTPETNGESADGEQTITGIDSDTSKQATVVQIVEDISGNSQSSVWKTAFAITGSANIKPQDMVKNYPDSWKKNGTSSGRNNGKTGVPFFSVEQHASWYEDKSGSQGFKMPWRQYITNLGNMYGFQGTLFMFGGNGTIFNDPEALSIGLFRIKFGLTTPEVVGLPYAFVFSGISWFIDVQPSVDGSTGVWFNQQKPIEYDSKLPLGQDATFSFVPRMAVAGVQPNFTSDDSSIPSYLYLAGTMTTGQSTKSQSKSTPTNAQAQAASSAASGGTTIKTGAGKNGKTNGWEATYDKTSTRSLQPSGENEVASQPLAGKATTENSIDPLILFGTPLSLSALMSFDSNTANNPYQYTNLMVNGRYYDVPVFPGFQSGAYKAAKQNPVLSTSQASLQLNASSGSSSVAAQTVNVHDDLVWTMSRYLLTSTLVYGHSTKNVSGLVQFTDEKGNEGYMYQVGVSTISFRAPSFDVSSLVYRNPAKTTFSQKNIGDGYLGGKVNSNTNEYWFTSSSGSSSNPSLTLQTMVEPSNEAVFDNWKVEDYTAHWKYSDLSKQVHKSQQAQRVAPVNSAKQESKLKFSSFRGLSSALDDREENNSVIQSAWENQTTARAGTAASIMLTQKPLLTVYTDAYKSKGDKVHQNVNVYISVSKFSSSNSSSAQSENYLVSWKNPSDSQVQVYGNQPELYKNHNEKPLSILFASEANSPQSSFVGQLEENVESGKKDFLTMMNYSSEEGLEFVTEDSSKERLDTLGYGQFTGSLSNDLLQKNISDLFDFDVNVPGIGSGQTVLNKKWLPQFFDIKKDPKWEGPANDSIDKVKLVVTNVDLVTQSMTITAYAYNQESGTYALMPSSNNSSEFASINVANFTGFKALASWVLPVAIAVPIVIISLVIGLGLGIGLPMQKNKQMLKLGFELQNKKVDTLTTAVGGVFKKIISQTKSDNLKKTPQMLKAASPKPAGAPGAAPAAPGAAPKAPGAPAPAAAPTTAPGAAPTKPVAPAAPKAPGAPA